MGDFIHDDADSGVTLETAVGIKFALDTYLLTDDGWAPDGGVLSYCIMGWPAMPDWKSLSCWGLTFGVPNRPTAADPGCSYYVECCWSTDGVLRLNAHTPASTIGDYMSLGGSGRNGGWTEDELHSGAVQPFELELCGHQYALQPAYVPVDSCER